MGLKEGWLPGRLGRSLDPSLVHQGRSWSEAKCAGRPGKSAGRRRGHLPPPPLLLPAYGIWRAGQVGMCRHQGYERGI